MQDWAVTSQTKHVKAKKNIIDTSSSTLPHPLAPHLLLQLKAKIENDAVFKDGDEQHDAEPGQHAQVLQDKVSQLAALVVLAVAVKHLWQHIHQGHIKEHASCDGKDPVGDIVCVLAHSCANQHANVGHEGGQQIVDNGLLH